MTEINSQTFYPFTVKQLMVFREEILEAGNFDKLMRQKEALVYENGEWDIAVHENIKSYKAKFLCGVYEPLRKHYVTQTPYSFWSHMNEMLKKAETLL